MVPASYFAGLPLVAPGAWKLNSPPCFTSTLDCPSSAREPASAAPTPRESLKINQAPAAASFADFVSTLGGSLGCHFTRYSHWLVSTAPSPPALRPSRCTATPSIATSTSPVASTKYTFASTRSGLGFESLEVRRTYVYIGCE